jgi:LMBR1 domain-containing protein 1
MSFTEAGIFIIVGIVLMILILLVVNIYTFVNYASPDDNNEHIFPKLVVVVGLQTSMMCVLLLPIDVANNSGNPNCDTGSGVSGAQCGGINLFLMWEALFMFASLLLIFFIPFAAFFYLADDGVIMGHEEKRSKALPALFNTLVVVITASAIILGLYFTSGHTAIPVSSYEIDFQDIPVTTYSTVYGWVSPYQLIQQSLTASQAHAALTKSITFYITVTVSFPIYVIAIVGWLGWWAFSFFAGAGLASLPFDLIYDFLKRVKTLSPDLIAEKERDIQTRTAELLETAVAIKRSRIEFDKTGPSSYQRRRRLIEDRVQVNRVTQFVFLLEQDTTDLREAKAYNSNAGNPLTPYAKLVAGVVAVVVSFFWFLQIVLYMLPSPPVTTLLNSYFTLFDSWFPIFGVLTFAIFAYYLLMCTIKGAFRVGLSLFCIKIYPMVLNGTYTDAFLFNVAMVLVCTIPVVQFCLYAFSNYARYTDIYSVGCLLIYSTCST